MTILLSLVNLLCNFITAIVCLVILQTRHDDICGMPWRFLRYVVGLVLIGAAGNVVTQLQSHAVDITLPLSQVIFNLGVTMLSAWVAMLLERHRATRQTAYGVRSTDHHRAH